MDVEPPPGGGGLPGWTGFIILVEAIRLRYGNQDEEAENIETKEKASSDKAR